MINLASNYTNQGRYDEAEPIFLEALKTQKRVLRENHPDTAWTLHWLACLGALRGDHPTALNWLRQAADAGYYANAANADELLKDPSFTSLHGDPEFEAIVAEVKKQLGQEDAD
jgi:hypothetical protein